MKQDTQEKLNDFFRGILKATRNSTAGILTADTEQIEEILYLAYKLGISDLDEMVGGIVREKVNIIIDGLRPRFFKNPEIAKEQLERELKIKTLESLKKIAPNVSEQAFEENYAKVSNTPGNNFFYNRFIELQKKIVKSNFAATTPVVEWINAQDKIRSDKVKNE